MRPLFMHDGVDLVAATGTPVYAAADGIVIGAAPNGGYGNSIQIDHQARPRRSTATSRGSRRASNMARG